MRSNKGRDTRPELALRRAVHAGGLRYQVSKRPIRQVRRTADMVFTRVRLAVFMDGCFWHVCPIHHTEPETNAAFWTAKHAANQARDLETTRILEEAGWTVLRVWEHEDPIEAAVRVVDTYWRLRNDPPKP